MKEDLVSVIIPTYNRADTIEMSIRSVLNQSYNKIEVIVVNDASTDDTCKIIDGIKDERVKVYNLKTNQGAARARNYGISKASGYYVAFQDSDDIWAWDKLDKQIAEMKKMNADFCFSKFCLAEDRNLIYPQNSDIFWNTRDFIDCLIEWNRCGTPTIVMRTEFINKIGCFNEELKSLEDWEMVVRAALVGRAAFIDETLVFAQKNGIGVNEYEVCDYLDAAMTIIEETYDRYTDKSVYEYIVNTIYDKFNDIIDKTVVERYINWIVKIIGGNEILSIVIPVYNVEKYLEECLQTINNNKVNAVEIIIVNDGSTDASRKIIDRFIESSGNLNIKVIDKENTGYGNSLNIGLENSNGKYIGIVESDDCVVDNMFLKMLVYALLDVDIIKGNYNKYFYKENLYVYEDNLKGNAYRKVLDEDGLKRNVGCAPTIWSGIYKRNFLKENNIRFLDTQGAAYQDTSYSFKIWTLAKKGILLEDPIINYRVDREESSSNSKNNIFKICDEIEEMKEFVSRRSELQREFYLARQKSYEWNANRLDVSDRVKFWLGVYNEYLDIKEESLDGIDCYLANRIRYISKDILGFCKRCISDKDADSETLIELLKNIENIYVVFDGISIEKIRMLFNDIDIEVKGFISIDNMSEIQDDAFAIVVSERDVYEKLISKVRNKHVFFFLSNLEELLLEAKAFRTETHWCDDARYSLVYNSVFYKNKYFRNVEPEPTEADLFKHFIEYGLQEGRQGSRNFNVNSYLLNNRDLQDGFGLNIRGYYVHYAKFGYYEGRRGN